MLVITLMQYRMLIKKENRRYFGRSVANIPFSIEFFPGYTARLIHEPNLFHVYRETDLATATSASMSTRIKLAIE